MVIAEEPLSTTECLQCSYLVHMVVLCSYSKFSDTFFRTTFSTTATDINNLTRQSTYINGKVLPALILVVAESKVGFLVEKPSNYAPFLHALTL